MEPLKNPILTKISVLQLLLVSCLGVGAQFYSDYGDGGGTASYPYNTLHPFEIPVIYKQQSYPAAYPVAPLIYQVALMKPIEPMPGKKTVPLYMVPEDSLLVNSNDIEGHSREKRNVDHPLRVNIKYPEFYGLTDGYHIPAVEIPLNKPMIVRQIEVNVLAPEGFMVPFQSEDRQWPYPMTTGCLVASIPRNTYVSDEHPITIRRLFAVPSLPEYPTYRPAFPNHNQLYATQPHGPHPQQREGQQGLTVNLYPPGGQQGPIQVQGPARPTPIIYAHPEPPKPKTPVFELVPVTPKSKRRNGKRRNNNGSDSEEDEDDSKNRDSKEESEEDERDRRCREGERGRGRSRNGGGSSSGGRRNCRRDRDRNSSSSRDRDSDGERNRDRDNDMDRNRDRDSSSRDRDRENDRNRDRNSDRNRDRDSDRDRNRDRDPDRNRNRDPIDRDVIDRDRSTTEKSTTTTPPTTTPAASSIQDIIAAFSSFRDREREQDDRRNRISASFYQDEERDRTRQQPGRTRDRDRDNEGLRSGTPSRERDEPVREAPLPPPSSSEGSGTPSSPSTPTPTQNNLQELREQVLQRQINQLQTLLSRLNISQEPQNNATSSR